MDFHSHLAASAGSRRCPLVVGDLLVYRDTNHMTTAYARSLAPLLGRVLPRLT